LTVSKEDKICAGTDQEVWVEVTRVMMFSCTFTTF